MYNELKKIDGQHVTVFGDHSGISVSGQGRLFIYGDHSIKITYNMGYFLFPIEYVTRIGNISYDGRNNYQPIITIS